jgi:hypothetical protein
MAVVWPSLKAILYCKHNDAFALGTKFMDESRISFETRGGTQMHLKKFVASKITETVTDRAMFTDGAKLSQKIILPSPF